MPESDIEIVVKRSVIVNEQSQDSKNEAEEQANAGARTHNEL
jgi:hypothetical protein